MNRCVAFAGPGTRGKPAGPVPLMSKRSTTATYFDHQGIMRTAQPYELRPNYVYQNGVWVQDGWLREGASTNLFQMDTTQADLDGLLFDYNSNPKYQAITGFLPDICPDGVTRKIHLAPSSNVWVGFQSHAPIPYDASKNLLLSFFMKSYDTDNGHNVFTLTTYARDPSVTNGQNMGVKGVFYPLWSSANTAGCVNCGSGWYRYWFNWDAGNTGGSVWSSGQPVTVSISVANPSWSYSKSIWGIQVEQGVSGPTSLIENTNASIFSRYAD